MQEGNPTCCESPASIKGRVSQCRDLKETETREKVYRKQLRTTVNREPDAQNRENQIQSKGKWTGSTGTARHGANQIGEAGNEMLGNRVVLLLLLLPWTAQGRLCQRTAALLGLGANSSHSNSAC